MRGCEIKGLQWKNVELDREVPVFRIQRATTKTDAGERVIPIHPSTLLLLRKTHENARSVGVADGNHFVFAACECGRFDPNNPD
jgi:integrase